MAGKTFRFSLDHVLRLRKHQTEEARRHLERAVEARRDAERLVAEAESILSDRVMQNIPDGPTGSTVIQRIATFREDARRKLEIARHQLNKLKQVEDEARRFLTERRRNEETLEQLREAEKDEHDSEVAASELAFIDEQALAGYLRKNIN